MHLELKEQGDAVEVELDAAAVRSMQDAVRRWRRALGLRGDPFDLDDLGGGRIRLASRGVAGFIRVPGVSIEVAPKFLDSDQLGPSWRRALWRLLAYGEGAELAHAEAAGQALDRDGIADVLADLFLASVKGAASRGFPFGYVARNELSPHLRGRLRTERVADYVPFRGALPIRSSRLTRDVPVNRLLKWAAVTLAAQVELPFRRQSLVSWASLLEDVRAQPPASARLPDLHRHHPHLVVAVDIAKLLLADRQATFGLGGLNLPGFLWNTEVVFERAVRRLTDGAARSLGMAADKQPHVFLTYKTSHGTTAVSTTPDVTVHKAGATKTLLDAKYKSFSGEPLNADAYQVLAGGRATGVPVVGLVYQSATARLSATRSFTPTGTAAT